MAPPRVVRRTRPSARRAVGARSQARSGGLRWWSRRDRRSDRPRGVHEPDVTERLWEVPEQLTRMPIDFLREETDVVYVADGGLESGPCRVDVSGERLAFRQPERAQQEGSLLAFEPVGREIPIDQPAL